MATKEWDSVLYNVDGPIAKISMNRPEVLNAQDTQLLEEVMEAFDEAAADDNVRVIILAGEGRSFSSGHDLGRARQSQDRKPPKPGAWGILEREEEIFVDWCMKVRDIGKPTIAMVQGYAIIGGWMLANACDLIVAAEDAKFSDRAARFAAPSGEFNTYVYDMGARKAKEMLFTGDYLGAEELHRMGAINKVVPNDQLEEATMELAAKIAQIDPFLLKLVKRSVNEVQDAMGFRHAMRTQHYLHVMAHAHFRIDGVQSPVEGREKGLKEWLANRDAKFGE
jgi:enoyl-CoA hydratase